MLARTGPQALRRVCEDARAEPGMTFFLTDWTETNRDNFDTVRQDKQGGK